MDYKYLLEIILKFKNQGIIVVDNNANIVYFNESNGNIFESDPKYAIGKNVLDIFDGITKEESTIHRVLRTNTPIINYVHTFNNFKGNRVISVTTTIPLFKDNEIIGVLEILEDINDYKELYRKILELQNVEGKSKINNEDIKSNGTIYTLNNILGNSYKIQELKKKIYKIADSSSPVLVYGETGTGKELVAQSIHNASFKRRKKPFIAQNCAAIPRNLLESILFGTTAGSFTDSKEKPGIFELADGGTLLLDEINSMDIDLQAKLLRVLQEGMIRRVGGNKTIRINVRVIASTNIPPLEAVEKGVIRKDLYYRLNVISLNVAPLRERKEDIQILTKHFIDIYSYSLNKEIVGISEECLERLYEYNWPGNVRELRYTIENIISFLDDNRIEVYNLPEYIRNINRESKKLLKNELINEIDEEEIPPLKDTVKDIEIRIITKALIKTKGNRAKAARILKIPRQTLNSKINKYGIEEEYGVKLKKVLEK
ncbi:MAG: sigma 54-interacting transcriptional regulator [Maledivibacter sp.]|nr:sigma 54-interacting transcriptional regulator [Maledivibacter sp.]